MVFEGEATEAFEGETTVILEGDTARALEVARAFEAARGLDAARAAFGPLDLLLTTERARDLVGLTLATTSGSDSIITEVAI